MTTARTTTRRRPPPPQDRYRGLARAAKRTHAGRGFPPVVTGIVWGIVLASAALVADTTAGGLRSATGSFGSFVTTLIPAPVPAGDLTVTETTGQIGAAPLLDATPQFTKEPALLVQGLVPSFGRAADRKVSVSLNGGAALVVRFDTNGRFAAPITLVEGTNQLIVALEAASNERIAATTVTIVLDRLAPPLSLTKPKNGDTIDGPNLTVEGKTEPGATVLVNDRSVIVGQDGAFSDAVTVPAGPLAIMVIARDRAGNETKTQLSVTVKAQAAPGAAATTVTVILASATVKPGGFVTANITVLSGAVPVAGLTTSLQVGVISIGTALTDGVGHATISFFAPPNEGIAQVVVLAGNASGSATLTIAK